MAAARNSKVGPAPAVAVADDGNPFATDPALDAAEIDRQRLEDLEAYYARMRDLGAPSIDELMNMTEEQVTKTKAEVSDVPDGPYCEIHQPNGWEGDTAAAACPDGAFTRRPESEQTEAAAPSAVAAGALSLDEWPEDQDL